MYSFLFSIQLCFFIVTDDHLILQLDSAPAGLLGTTAVF